MDITMYDCGFGDCFLLDNDGSHLLVDFGIHDKATTIVKSSRYQDILQDLSRVPNANQLSFLLSHYHDDHFGGLDYMINTPVAPHLHFENVYIPNVWDARTCTEIVALLMISFLRKGLSIFTFIKNIIRLNGAIHLVSAGSIIENDYIALWPQIPLLRNKAIELFENNNHENIQEYERLHEISSRLIAAFTERMDGEQIIDENEEDIDRIENDFLNALDDNEFRTYVKGFAPRSLNSFGNEVSIVFHNRNDLDNNILFTGDAGTENHNKNGRNYVIDTLATNNLLYPQYTIIKLPHHGTLSYFSDELCNRLNRKNPFLLMSNGSLKNTYLSYLPTIAYYDYCNRNITNAQIIRANDFGANLKTRITI